MSRPWMKFYPADWQADPCLRSCSLAARGLWMEMLCLMQKSDEIGHLLIAGKPPTPAQLSVLCGSQKFVVVKCLAELHEAGVFDLTDGGVMVSRRMVRDAQREERDKANGRKGGNPSVKRGVNPQVNGGDKAQKPEARSQIYSEDKSSARNEDFDPDKRAWSDAVVILTAGGRIPETTARRFFGKLLSDNKLVARDLAGSLATVAANGTQDPQGYLTRAAAMVSKRRNGASEQPVLEEW